ncbi:MAG: 23S rRNA (adenine(2503)-C(2))-methyltransferase RlmN [Deltaproteobacteria bacterium]|nr:MAG: 23S rRNA (adenine(2503)-C(2))-methyltransferase RlmN [Deltaproteobacteria bacterium]
MRDVAPLKNLTPTELETWVQEAGQPVYRAKQLLKWIYGRDVENFQAMTDLSKDFRAWLTRKAHVSCLRRESVVTDVDGTRKLLFRLWDGECIESVLINEGARLTLCISSQVGCAYGCRFCLTGQSGWRRDLSAGEIVDQVCGARRELGPEERLTNLVFMGMGEPLANFHQVVKAIEILTADLGLNFSTRKITLSTVGLVPEIERLSRTVPVKLAVSLHAADSDTRSRLMPINNRYPLEQLLEVCYRLPLPPRQRITFEYLLIDGVNDSPAAARQLARLLKGFRAKINLIPFNEYPGGLYRRPPSIRIAEFQQILQEKHFTATVRQSRGAGIMAACGQLTHSHQASSASSD